MKTRHLVVILALLTTSLAFGQETLTNDSVLKMVKGGLGDDVIVSLIQNPARAL